MQDGEKLKRLRMINGYSQKVIAKKLGITQQAYSKMENQQTKIHEARFKEILQAMKCSPDELKKIEIFIAARKIKSSKSK
jgi:transcriptional regulator with XRE-family HTH domain